MSDHDPFAAFEGLKEPGMPAGPPIRDFPGKRPPKNRASNQRAPEARVEVAADRWDSHPKMLPVEGREVELFSIGDFARALNRKPVTLRAWESAGVIPNTRIRTPKPKGAQVPGAAVKGKRLYTRHQVETALAAAQQYGLMADPAEADWSGFTTAVIAAWRADPFFIKRA